MEIDYRLVWAVVSTCVGVVAMVLVFMLRSTFAKKDSMQAIDKRVQTVEETYVPKPKFDGLDRRLGKVESSLDGLPELTKNLNDEIIELRTTARHMTDTINQLNRPIQLIIEAAMKGDK